MRSGDNNLRRIGVFAVDLDRRILWVNEGPADLPVKAVELLCALVEREGEVVSKDELLERVWPGTYVEEGVLSQNVYLLRKIFKQHGLPDDLIQTVARRGYRFIEGASERQMPDITIEREIIEQTSITEREYVEEPEIVGNAWPQRSRVAFAAVGVAILIGAVGLYFALITNAGPAAPSVADPNVRLSYEKITASGRAFYVGLSPDNENAAYVLHTADNKYALSLYHLASKSETTIIQPQEEQILNIQFSPDGNSIYYAGLQGDLKKSIYRIPIYGGTPQLITRELTHHYMLSPDGEWVAYYRRVPENEEHHLEICRSRDGSEKRTITVRRGTEGFIIWGAAPAWSPDGKRFAAAAFTKKEPGERGRVHLVEIDISTGAHKDIPAPDWHAAHQPYWAPNGEALYVMVREDQGDPMQLWYLDHRTGAVRKITNDNNDYREFRVASDGSFIMASTWTKSENLFLVPVDDPDSARQLTFDDDRPNGATALAWTRDGRSLVFSKAEGIGLGNLWRMDIDSLAQRQLTFDKGAFPHYADVTPDGRSVVFGYNKTGKWHIWQVDLDGDDLKQITNGNYEAAPEISPDGKWLYYLSDGLQKRPIEGGEPVKLMGKGPGTVRVSPADPSVFAAYFNDRNEKEKNPWRYVLFSGPDLSKYRDLNIPATVFFEWKPDGSGIYYIDNGESFSNIWFVNSVDLSRYQITKFTDQKIGNFSVSPDGKTFAISRGSAIGNILKLVPK